MWFPSTIVRANAADPNKMYPRGSSVVLSPTDSMFYHTTVRHGPYTSCYISAFVPSPPELAASTKSFVATGDISAIEVWNITGPPDHSLSWNTRPHRVFLLGTVNFTAPEPGPWEGRDGKEIRPPTPLFDCSGRTSVNVEVSCTSCTLQFEQLFSDPPLAFNVYQLGWFGG